MILRPLAILALAVSVLTPVAAVAVPVGQVVTAASITAVADKVAFAQVNDPDRTVAPARGIGDQSLPLGTLAMNAGTPQVNASFIAVPVSLAVDGKVRVTLLVTYRITQYIRTAAAAHQIDSGTILGPDDLELDRVPFAGRQPVDIASLVGRKVRTSVTKGTQLYVEQTAVVELVKAGSTVVLIVRDGPVALAADVVARNSGGLGETVAVYNPGTKKALTGVVTGPNRVELNLPSASPELSEVVE
jgi:flagella basal body P-ring formation protein FlgA